MLVGLLLVATCVTELGQGRRSVIVTLLVDEAHQVPGSRW